MDMKTYLIVTFSLLVLTVYEFYEILTNEPSVKETAFVLVVDVIYIGWFSSYLVGNKTNSK